VGFSASFEPRHAVLVLDAGSGGSGEATWADFAEGIFGYAAAYRRRQTRVKRIATADHPTPARRPAKSRLDNAEFKRTYNIELPDWRASLADCIARLIPSPAESTPAEST
jgi:dTDP-4-dehydrorhamnose reductase